MPRHRTAMLAVAVGTDPATELTPALGRRALLGAAVVAGTAAATGGPTVAAVRPRRVPVTRRRERAVVVGSGFAGGVAALRLGRAGVRTLVLERGIRWPTGPDAETFPHFLTPDRRASWLADHPVMTGPGGVTWQPYAGLLERVGGDGMDIFCGAGVGGGSLVYHGMTLQPSAATFARSMPSLAGVYGLLDAVHYPRVARMLRLETVPDDVLAADPYRSSRVFTAAAEAAGLRPFRVPLPVDWSFARRELRGELKPSYTNSDLIYGVNNGGKHSIDVTYLAAAVRTGNVRVATLHVARDLSRDVRGRWVLRVDRIDTDGNVLEHVRVTSDAVFLCAGSAGTTRLLVKARAKGLVPDLPDAVGTRWGNNGDRIYAWLGMRDDPGTTQGGPACVGLRDWDNPAGPLTVVHSGVPVSLRFPIMTLIGFGVPEGHGTFAYDAATDDAKLTWPRAADATLVGAIRSRVEGLAAAGGGFVFDTTALEPTTYHPLGGVPVDEAVDHAGRVLGQRGLYVLDGARIPGSTGACNPSMTIAALAEHSLDHITRRDVARVF